MGVWQRERTMSSISDCGGGRREMLSGWREPTVVPEAERRGRGGMLAGLGAARVRRRQIVEVWRTL